MTASYCPTCGRFHANSTGACMSRQTVVGTVTHSPDFVARTPEGRAALLSSAEAKLDSVERWLRSQDEIAALRARVADLEAERDGALALLAGAVDLLVKARNLAVEHGSDCPYPTDYSAPNAGCTCGLVEVLDSPLPSPARGAAILAVVEAARVWFDEIGPSNNCPEEDALSAALRRLDPLPPKEG